MTYWWLVENFTKEGQSTGLYMACQVNLTLTGDVNEARKFRRQRTAEFRAADMRDARHGDWRAVQHGFDDSKTPNWRTTMNDAVRDALVELVMLADTVEKAHNPTWDAAWNAARAALSEPPTDPSIESDELVICPECCTQFRAIPVQVQRLLLASGHEPPFTAHPAPVERVTLSDEQVRSIGGTAFGIDIAFDGHLMAFARAVIAEYERANGIGTRQPLSDAQIIDLRDDHLPSQGERFDCLAFARLVERAHGIGAAQGNGGE